jgi:hypothetical protein
MALLARGKKFDISIVNLTIDEKTSIERQLYRGRMAEMHNKNVHSSGDGELIEVRKIDLDVKSARDRYRTFLLQTKEALSFLIDKFGGHEISACGSFDEIKERIYKELRPRE